MPGAADVAAAGEAIVDRAEAAEDMVPACAGVDMGEGEARCCCRLCLTRVEDRWCGEALARATAACMGILEAPPRTLGLDGRRRGEAWAAAVEGGRGREGELPRLRGRDGDKGGLWP